MGGNKRYAQMGIVTGMQGSGKTFQTRKQLDEYIKVHKTQSVLVFDPNNEKDYHDLYPIYWDVLEVLEAKEVERKSGYTTRIITRSEKIVGNLPPGKIYRVIPFTRFNDKMNIKQMTQTMMSLCQHYANGLLLLDDVNVYLSNFESDEVKGALKNLRHKKVDVILHLQSLNPLRRIHVETARVIRMHMDNMDIKVIKTKLGDKFPIMAISKFLLEIMYHQGNDYPYVYIHTRENKIVGDFSYKEYIQACQKFLIRNDGELTPFRRMANKDYQKSVELWINEYQYYGNGSKKWRR